MAEVLDLDTDDFADWLAEARALEEDIARQIKANGR